jgi:hypothetical protein
MSVGSTARRRPAATCVGVLTGLLMVVSAPLALAGEASDPQGDTINDETDQPMDVAEADILKSWISAQPNGILLGVQVRKPTDPAAHPAWVDGDSSAEWDLDTTGDSKPDFTVILSNDDGKMVGAVQRFDAAEDEEGDAEDLCAVSHQGYAPDKGYNVVVDPACVGSPKTVAYQAEFYYDTSPGDDNAPEAADTSPDQGMSTS